MARYPPEDGVRKNNAYHDQPIVDVELSQQYPAVWEAMEATVDSGKALAIGGSALLHDSNHGLT